MITIRLVRPGEDMNVVVEFYRRQNRSYSKFSAQKAVYAPTESEIVDGFVYYVVAQDLNTGDLCGGLRIHLRSPDAPLPIERALPEDGRLQQILGQSGYGLAEMSGLWVEDYLRGTGLSSELMRVGVAAMPLLGVDKVLAFTHQHVLDFWTPIGFYVDATLEKTYPYPDHRYRSRIIWIDPNNLGCAEHVQRMRIFLLRSCLAQGQLIYWPQEPVLTPVALEGHAS